MIPQTTSDLVVTQRGPRVVLAWSYPALTTAGKKLGTVRRVDVYRVTQPTTEPPLTPPQFNKLKVKVDSIEGARLPAASNGAKLTYDDTPPVGQRSTYGVVTEGATATGAVSNLGVIAPIEPPSPPHDFAAAAKPEGVVLSWQKPSTGTVAGYNVYRTASTETFDELAAPVNPAPVPDTKFTDVPPYGTFDYRVTAVAQPGPPRIESEPAAPATATFKDLLPPPTPANFAALIEPKAVRLVWDPVEAPDLSGYVVYRIEGTARLLMTQGVIIPQTSFRDISLQPGVTYVYEVSSIDRAHNESPPARTGPVMLPLTP